MTRKTPSHHRHDQHVGDAAESSDHHSADPQAIVPGASDPPTDDQGRQRGTYTVGYCRPPVHSRFKPGQSITVDADPVGTTLVFSAEGESVVADAGERRDARRRAEEDEPVAAAASAGRGGSRRKSVLDLPDSGGSDNGGSGRPN